MVKDESSSDVFVDEHHKEEEEDDRKAWMEARGQQIRGKVK